VKDKLSNWLKKQILRLRNRKPPSPAVRKIAKVLQITVLILFCSFLVWRLLLYQHVAKQFARIRAAGLPTSGAELNTWRGSVPEPENGALVLTQAFALLRNLADSRSNEVAEASLLARTDRWKPDTRDLVQGYLQTNQPALAKVREALLLSKFAYPVDFSFGPDTQLPHLGRLKEISRITCLQAVADAEQAEPNKWAEDVVLALKVARTLDDEPIIISHLVRCAIIRMAVRATERSLNQVAPGVETCKLLQNAFDQATGTNLLALAFIGERAMTIPIFRLSWKEIQYASQSDDPEQQPRKPQRYSGKPMAVLWLTGFFERDLDFFLEVMDKSISIVRLPSPQNLQLTNYLDSASTLAAKRLDIYSTMLLPSFSRVIVREASTQAHVRLAITALAVERFRQERGQLPRSLEELAPEFLLKIPTDPFDGAPLRYRVLAKGYIIYSIDADGRDDGEREAPERIKSRDNSSYDITFKVER